MRWGCENPLNQTRLMRTLNLQRHGWRAAIYLNKRTILSELFSTSNRQIFIWRLTFYVCTNAQRDLGIRSGGPSPSADADTPPVEGKTLPPANAGAPPMEGNRVRSHSVQIPLPRRGWTAKRWGGFPKNERKGSKFNKQLKKE